MIIHLITMKNRPELSIKKLILKMPHTFGLSVVKKGHRLSQNKFVCDNLHLQNADYNVSLNIAKSAI